MTGQTFLSTWRARHAGRITEIQRSVYRFRHSRLSILGGAIITLAVLIAVSAPVLAPYPEDAAGAIHMQERLEPPGPRHWFGTDDLGRDIFSRVVLGTSISLRIGITVVLISVTVGGPLGIMAGYFGGVTNEIVMRMTDMFLVIPALILAMTVAAMLRSGIISVMLAVSVVRWPVYCRLVQAQVLSIKEENYVEAARGLGASDWRLMFVHILPNCVSPLIVRASLDMGYAILIAASLGFLGLGAREPTPEWGLMVAYGRRMFPLRWWCAAFPGLAISLVVLGFNFLGDGLRDVLDPKRKR